MDNNHIKALIAAFNAESDRLGRLDGESPDDRRICPEIRAMVRDTAAAFQNVEKPHADIGGSQNVYHFEDARR